MPVTPPFIPRQSESSHYYYKDGRPCHEVPYADPSKGMRSTTLKDARKLGLLPSVTTILRVLNRPALTEWLIETACLTVLTAPKLHGEDLDAFIKRVLTTEKQQDQEAQKARDLGTAVHAEIELRLNGGAPDPLLDAYCLPAIKIVNELGRVVASEKIIVGNGYAGTLDALLEGNETTIVDFKTCKKLPKESWDEHKLQLSAYAVAAAAGSKKIQTANIYISTSSPGECVLCLNHDWSKTYFDGFRPLVQYWCWLNSYLPPITTPLASTEDMDNDRLYRAWNEPRKD
jgi:hypothetical protein